ncbi:hypothetical protein TRFO_13006 [Tritrichomonas foetus]|uniref:Uncharacterized protein n=1 Tax=Tritrichomonas foetus TaxID=1144522 RepID=A0A1J4KZQ6_9EUKA|nr:hypothetical protein TRFO_13006 [Tritrichomonas foetus]|eukprot:OHT16735.1 hypothetical protein TRFO_13006 [Tritrichomonas foetus]
MEIYLTLRTFISYRSQKLVGEKISEYMKKTNDGKRGIRTILYSLYQSPCSIPFNCETQFFEEKDGSTTELSCVDGKGIVVHQKGARNDKPETTKNESTEQRTEDENPIDNNGANEELNESENQDAKQNNEINENPANQENSQKVENNENHENQNNFDYVTSTQDAEAPKYDQTVFLNNGEIEGDCPEDIIPKLKKIGKHIQDSVAALYDIPVLTINLHFGISNEDISLLPDSFCTTSTQTLGDNSDDIEARFGEFYSEEMAKKIDHSKCYMNLKDCQFPDFKAPLSKCLILKAKAKFPETSCARLHDLIEPRFESGKNPKVFLCVRCMHKLSSLDYTAYIEHIETPELKTLPPSPFQPVVPSELFEKRRYPMGLNPNINKPFSFTSNVENSPYKIKLAAPKKPSYGTYVKPSRLVNSQPQWVIRLMDRSLIMKKNPKKVSRECERPNSAIPKMKMFTEPPEPLERVKKHYQNPPFNIGKIDPNKKRWLHKKGESFCYRFADNINSLDTSGMKEGDDRPPFQLK